MMEKAGAIITGAGKVTGFSGLPGGKSRSIFLWTKGNSVCTGHRRARPDGSGGRPAGFNKNSQVVGGSCDITGNCRAFLENKVMSGTSTDFHLPGTSTVILLYWPWGSMMREKSWALPRGENSTGEVHAYLANSD